MMTMTMTTPAPDNRGWMTMEQKSRCVWRTLPDGTHEFTFMESSHAAVDTWVEYLVTIAQREDSGAADGIFRCLLDVRLSGPQPMYSCLRA
jgi:hypothetical protein